MRFLVALGLAALPLAPSFAKVHLDSKDVGMRRNPRTGIAYFSTCKCNTQNTTVQAPSHMTARHTS